MKKNKIKTKISSAPSWEKFSGKQSKVSNSEKNKKASQKKTTKQH